MNKPKRSIITTGQLAWLLAIAAIVIDQAIKIEVKTTMTLGQSHKVFSWFYIYFIENNGMAYGMTFLGKFWLSLLRIIACTAIGWTVWQVVRQGGRRCFALLLALVGAGAAGNIVDSLFYGLCFTASTPWNVATSVPMGEGYASVLMGKVVDMFYFPIIHTQWPEWAPWVGGEEFIFFSPVFNFADACISVGVALLLLFCRKDMENIGQVVRKGLGMKTENNASEHQREEEQA